MIGFETKINEDEIPFHKAINPSFFISCLPFSTIEPFSYVCFVCKTQKGLVAKEAPIPAIAEHFMVSITEPASNPR